MENRNRFIVFASVLAALIILAFSSLIITANNNIAEKSGSNKDDLQAQKKYNIKPKSGKVRILIDPGHNAVTKGSMGWLGYEYYMTLRLAKQLTAILDEDNKFERFSASCLS